MKPLTLILLIIMIAQTGWSKNKKIPLIGDRAPSFSEVSTNGELNFPEDFGSNWKILFSHPLDFTAVCTSELCELAYQQKRFDSLGVKLAVVSIDEIERHLLWKESMEQILKDSVGPVQIHFPIIADLKGKISKKYGMLHSSINDTRDVRGVFFIDPDHIVQAINFYPMNVGRNIDEILRMLQALQLTREENVRTPANWQPGEDVLVPHKPYFSDDLKDNPDLKNKYYKVGDYMWFKKGSGKKNN